MSCLHDTTNPCNIEPNRTAIGTVSACVYTSITIIVLTSVQRCGNTGNATIEGMVYHVRTLLSIATSRLDGLQKVSLLLQCMHSLHRWSRRHTREGTAVFRSHRVNHYG